MSNSKTEGSPLDELGNELTARERLFALAYVNEARGNKTRAAELAGYKSDRRRSLTEIGCRISTKPAVRAYVEELLEAHTLRAAEVMREVSDIARQDLTPYLKVSGGELALDYEKMEKDGALHLIAGFEFNKQGDSIPVIHSKLAALTLMVRILRLGGDKVEHTGAVGITIREYPEGL